VEWPPLSARGWTGIAGGLLLAALAAMRGQSLRVPEGQWPRLLLSAFLNVTTWMTLMGLALLWLPASEAAVIAYTMPVWASLLAWLILGERMSLARLLALVMAFGGIAALLGGNGIDASMAKLPGILMVLTGAFAFALGTVAAKRLPITMPLIASSALQIGIGCVPVALAGLVFEHPELAALSALGWWLLAYMTVIQFCIAYVCWFAALERLPASVAAIGTMAVPVIGVVASALALHEPLGPGQIAALVFTLAGVALAARS
jgi:drug/metabolite transporter (DMT)-like permease